VTFIWPIVLVLLAILPLLVALRYWMLRHARPVGIRYSSLSLVRVAVPRSSRWRRHLPFALFVLGLGSLVLAMARPAANVAVPSGRSTVVLALDVSRSMCATDIEPNRLLAAEEAAIDFIERQGSDTQIGVVAFAGWAETVQTPTNDSEVLVDVIESLATGRRTAIGSAILESIDAIAAVDPTIPGSVDAAVPDAAVPPPVTPGVLVPAIIVLLTDGASNAGPMPLDAAQQAADRGVRVYTIGFGTADPDGGPPDCRLSQIGREPGDDGAFSGMGGWTPPGGGFGGFGGGFRRAIDEDTLIAVAEVTGGEYFPAESVQELAAVFASLPTHLIVRQEVVELAVVFTALAVALIGVAVLLGQAWRPWP
jgi:Ca-activated chloride channel family protein